MNTNTNTLKDAVILAGKIADMQAKLAGLLNCKASDINKTIAAMMEADSLKTVTYTSAGRTYSATYRAAAADGEKFDSDAAKKLLEDNGLPVPMCIRKGAAATAIIK